MEETVKLSFDSDEEMYMYWWLEELQSRGYIRKIEREPLSFKLSESVNTIQYKYTKTKTKSVTSHLLHAHEYTPDFIVYWTKKGIDVIFDILHTGIINKEVYLFAEKKNDEDGLYSYIEVKPEFDQNNMTRLFRINQKWVYKDYNEYINEVVPQKLFASTFTPKRFLTNNKDGKPRKIKFKVVLLDEFLSKFEGTQQQLFI